MSSASRQRFAGSWRDREVACQRKRRASSEHGFVQARLASPERAMPQIRRCGSDRVQVVVDACQMRLGRPRLRKYLDRGCMVIVTGSKFFTGPPFSVALLVPAGFAGALGAVS